MTIEHVVISDDFEIIVVKFFLSPHCLFDFSSDSVAGLENAFTLRIMEFVDNRLHSIYSSGTDYTDDCLSKVVIVSKKPSFSLS